MNNIFFSKKILIFTHGWLIKELQKYSGYAANNPNAYYFENGEAIALITMKANGNGLHGHAQTGNTSTVS